MTYQLLTEEETQRLLQGQKDVLDNGGTLLQKDQDLQELEDKISLLEEAKIILKVSAVTFDRLLKVAEFKNQTIEEYCTDLLEESLKVAVGKATITGPSHIGGSEQKKVIGPSNQSLVSRG